MTMILSLGFLVLLGFYLSMDIYLLVEKDQGKEIIALGFLRFMLTVLVILVSIENIVQSHRYDIMLACLVSIVLITAARFFVLFRSQTVPAQEIPQEIPQWVLEWVSDPYKAPETVEWLLSVYPSLRKDRLG